MKARYWFACMVVLVLAGTDTRSSVAMCWAHMICRPISTPAVAQSPIKGGALPPCQYCHAPHSGNPQRSALGADLL